MFTNEKITQVAAYLLNKAGGKLNYTAFLKLLYMADKKMLIEWGIPITYDEWFAMPYGPVLSHTYNLIRATKENAGYWGNYIRTSSYDIELETQPEDDLLSEAEEGIIDSIFNEHGGKTWKELVEVTHHFAEWDDPQGSSTPILYRQVLEVEGFPRDRIEEIIRNIEVETAITMLISSGSSNAR